MDKVKLHDLEKVLEPLFYHWKQKRQSKESFGNFTSRLVNFAFLTCLLIFKMIIMNVQVIGVFVQNDTIVCL
jgi:sulfite reductase beta subunit-like hemoprotein